MQLQVSLAVGLALAVAAVTIRARRGYGLVEGETLASIMAAFGLALAVVKTAYPAYWAVRAWGQIHEFQLPPDTNTEDLITAMAIGAICTTVSGLFAYLRILR